MSNSQMKEKDLSPDVAKDDEPSREEWNNHCEYFLSSLGLAVGLGNIWRFPYVCYDNGGGTFLIPYIIMLFLVGLPVFFMELSLGQYAGISATKIYMRMVPGLRGMGYGMAMIPTVINFYYTVIMAFAFYFLFSGFRSQLPWHDCSNEFNTITCTSLEDEARCRDNDNTTMFWKLKCTPVETFCDDNGYQFLEGNYTHCFSGGVGVIVKKVTQRVTASEDFWNVRVLGLNTLGNHVENRWENWGEPRWEIIGCLALCWTIICLCLIKGIQSYGKVVYFITLFPYVVLTTLLIYVSQLDGFIEGVKFYTNPKWEELTHMSVWKAAASQIFYSLGVAVGSQLILASYNSFKTNCHRDALLIGCCNSATSIYAGFVVFGTVGFIANKKGLEVEEVIKAGPGLAFVVYPEAVAAMEACPPLFSFIFFFMLVLLALSSVCGSWETLIGAINDQFPSLRGKRVLTMAVTCFVAFLAGVPMCFDSGFFLFTMMDKRTSNAILVMALLELLALSWFYGTDLFLFHIEEMGMKLPKVFRWFWTLSWNVTSPIIIFAVIIMSWSDSQPDSFLDYTYPPAAQFLGWLIEMAPIASVVLVAIVTVMIKKRQGEGVAFLKPGNMLRPKPTWGPRPDRDENFESEKVKGGADNQGFESVKL